MTDTNDPPNLPAFPPTGPNLWRIVAKAEEQAERHHAHAEQCRYDAARVMDRPVRGVRGGVLTVAKATQIIDEQLAVVDNEEAGGSLRHRLATRLTKVAVWCVVVLVDFPIMLWACASVFNVDWSAPWGTRLLFAFATAVLATLATAGALHHLGHELREHKNDNRGLSWRDLPVRPKAILIGVVCLVLLVALLMFVRVYTEGVLSGLDALAFLLAAVVAFVMLISASLVFWTAFRDGSPETDDLAYYTRLVRRHLNDRRNLESRAAWHDREADLILRRARRAQWR